MTDTTPEKKPESIYPESIYPEGVEPVSTDPVSTDPETPAQPENSIYPEDERKP